MDYPYRQTLSLRAHCQSIVSLKVPQAIIREKLDDLSFNGEQGKGMLRRYPSPGIADGPTKSHLQSLLI